MAEIERFRYHCNEYYSKKTNNNSKESLISQQVLDYFSSVVIAGENPPPLTSLLESELSSCGLLNNPSPTISSDYQDVQKTVRSQAHRESMRERKAKFQDLLSGHSGKPIDLDVRTYNGVRKLRGKIRSFVGEEGEELWGG
jgi:hypothetical protein